MSEFSVNDAMAKLGIYKSEAEALDAMDGKKDGKISKDIFTQAEEALTNAEAQYSEDNNGEVINLSKFSKVAQHLGRSIAQKMGFDAFVQSSNKNEDIEETMENDDRHEQVLELAGEAAKYIKEHKNLEGFKFTGLPNGVTNIKLDVDDYYGNSENDIVTFDNDGKAVIEKVIDGVSIEIHYTVNDTDYAVGFNTELEEEEDNSSIKNEETETKPEASESNESTTTAQEADNTSGTVTGTGSPTETAAEDVKPEIQDSKTPPSQAQAASDADKIREMKNPRKAPTPPQASMDANKIREMKTPRDNQDITQTAIGNIGRAATEIIAEAQRKQQEDK